MNSKQRKQRAIDAQIDFYLAYEEFKTLVQQYEKGLATADLVAEAYAYKERMKAIWHAAWG